MDSVVLQDDEDWPVVMVDGTVRRRRSWWTLLEGDSGRDAGTRISADSALTNFARLLRDYHDHVRDYVPPSDADWALPAPPHGRFEVMCHGDFAPWNVVWSGDVPVGILDFDMAHPGAVVDDVAYALAYSVPFRDDSDTRRMLGNDVVPSRSDATSRSQTGRPRTEACSSEGGTCRPFRSTDRADCVARSGRGCLSPRSV